MRAPALCLSLFLLTSCSIPPTLWHKATPDEIAQQEERDRRLDAEALAREAERERPRLEAERKANAVLQAFTLQDVRGCASLSRVYYVTLEEARMKAVQYEGNVILSQRNRQRDKYRGYVDDYDIYRCTRAKNPLPSSSPPASSGSGTEAERAAPADR